MKSHKILEKRAKKRLKFAHLALKCYLCGKETHKR
jgi:hypothetical protein